MAYVTEVCVDDDVVARLSPTDDPGRVEDAVRSAVERLDGVTRSLVLFRPPAEDDTDLTVGNGANDLYVVATWSPRLGEEWVVQHPTIDSDRLLPVQLGDGNLRARRECVPFDVALEVATHFALTGERLGRYRWVRT